MDRFTLGCGNYGGVGSAPEFFGQGESRDEAFALMDAAWELGIRAFDTAASYGGGRSERWIGEWMRDRDVRPVLTTKVFHSVTGDPGDRGLAPDRIRRELAGSLERLGVDRVDFYLVHEPDPDTPVEDTVAALDELASEGLVGAVGASNVDVAYLEQAERFEWVQNSHSLLERDEEVVAYCARRGLGYSAFGPLAGGWLTGKYRRDQAPPPGSRMTLRPEPYERFRTERVFSALERFEEEARRRAVAPAALALAWLLADERVRSVIVGPRRPAQLEPVQAALRVELTPAERDELAALFA